MRRMAAEGFHLERRGSGLYSASPPEDPLVSGSLQGVCERGSPVRQLTLILILMHPDGRPARQPTAELLAGQRQPIRIAASCRWVLI